MIIQILIPLILILIAIFLSFFLYVIKYSCDTYHYFVNFPKIINEMKEAKKQNQLNNVDESVKFRRGRYIRQGNRSIK